MPAPERALRCAFAVAGFAAGCAGSTSSVDPGRLAQSWVVGADEGALAAFLAAVETDPCSASARGADVDTAEVGLASAIVELTALADELCAHGVRGARVARDEFGLPYAAGPEGGLLRAENAVFVFPGYAGAVFAEGDVVASRAAMPCDADWALEPRTVHVVGDETAYVGASADVDVLVVRDADGQVECVHATDDTGPVAGLDPARGPYVVTAARDRDGSVRVALELRRAQGGTGSQFVWRVGDGIVRQVAIGPYVDDAGSIGSWCSGYVAASPDFVVRVPAEGWGFISVDSSADPVLVVRHEDGTVECNDDYDGLNPAIDMYLTPGRYEVWVGSFGSNSVFDATITFH